MLDSHVLPSPRHTVHDQFNKFQRMIDSVMLEDPNLNEQDAGERMAPAFHVVNTPFTRDFVTGPLKRKAEAILAEADRLKEVVVSMAVTSSEMSLLTTAASMEGDSRTPSVTMSRYIEVMREFIEATFIDNPGFNPGTDEEGNPTEAEIFALYPMTASYVRNMLPVEVQKIQTIVGNACGICSVMAMSGDERLILDRIIASLEHHEVSNDDEYEDAPEMGM